MTVAQFRLFLDANPDAERVQYEGAPDRIALVPGRFSPDESSGQLGRREREIMNAVFALGNRASAEAVRARA